MAECGGFPKLGVPFYGSLTRDYSILGSGVPPILGNYSVLAVFAGISSLTTTNTFLVIELRSLLSSLLHGLVPFLANCRMNFTLMASAATQKYGGFPKIGVPTIMENQMEKKMENEMETGFI